MAEEARQEIEDARARDLLMEARERRARVALSRRRSHTARGKKRAAVKQKRASASARNGEGEESEEEILPVSNRGRPGDRTVIPWRSYMRPDDVASRRRGVYPLGRRVRKK